MKNYTLIEKPSIQIIGIECRTSNHSEAGPVDIPKHWEKFFNQGIMDQIPNKISKDILALYCDYEGDYTQPYSLVIGCAVSSVDFVPEGMVVKIIPNGTYAMFRAVGEHPKSLIQTWETIWQQTNLKRTYAGDYELYSEKFSHYPQEVEVFIAVQDISSQEKTASWIKIVPYDNQWPLLFESEAIVIKQALGNNCVAIHHIGSTAVPGLSAKPVIDILPVVRDIQEVDKRTKAMESLGYETKGENGIAFRRYFQKGGELRTHNVHMYEEGDPEIDRYLRFRDWLRTHPEDAQKYAELKTKLAAEFSHDIIQYCNGKDAFVADIDRKDGFTGWRMVQALTDREWKAVRQFRTDYFFKSQPDPYEWTFEHADHIHFVFYKKAEIIGYCHLQLWPRQRAALRIIVIHENYRKGGMGGQFLQLCEKWLKQQGVKEVAIQSSPNAYAFYCKRGYVNMPFNDPEGYETDFKDIEMGKKL